MGACISLLQIPQLVQNNTYSMLRKKTQKTTAYQDWVTCDLQQPANLLSLEAGLQGNEIGYKASA